MRSNNPRQQTKQNKVKKMVNRIVKMRIIADEKINRDLIKFLSRLFEIPSNYIEGPRPLKDLTSSYLTFEYSEEKIKEVLD